MAKNQKLQIFPEKAAVRVIPIVLYEYDVLCHVRAIQLLSLTVHSTRIMYQTTCYCLLEEHSIYPFAYIYCTANVKMGG